MGDRLLTKNVAVSSSYKAGDTMTVTASGITNLHVPLETGAWQVRIYELGEAKSTATSVGDLMKSLKFDDAKNTTFTLKVSFPLPKKMASGKFSANLAAVDQAKADYMCLDIKYSYAAPVLAEVAPAAPFCLHQEDTVDPSASRHATPRARLSKARASPQLAHALPSTAPSTTPKPRSSAPMASPTCVTVLPPSSM